MPQTRSSYTTQDFYESYKVHVGNNPLYVIPKKVFADILRDYFTYLIDRILYKSAEVRLPSRMGYISVTKHKPKNLTRKSLRVDFGETKKNDKTILHLNEHSDGYNYRYYWSKRDMIIRHKSDYELVMSRDNKRLLAHIIKNKINDYIEL